MASIETALFDDRRAATAACAIAVGCSIDVGIYTTLAKALYVGIHETTGTRLTARGKYAATEAVKSADIAVGLALIIGIGIDRNRQTDTRAGTGQCLITCHAGAGALCCAADTIDAIPRFTDFVIFTRSTVVAGDHSRILPRSLRRRNLRLDVCFSAATDQSRQSKAPKKDLENERYNSIRYLQDMAPTAVNFLRLFNPSARCPTFL